MKKRTSGKEWFPFWIDKWIFGSMRIEFNAEERGIWIDFLALASKDSGYIRANEDTPYPLMQLSGMLLIPEDKLERAINSFIEKKKIKKYKNKTLKIIKWEKYQFSERHQRQISPPKSKFNIYEKTAISCPVEFSGMASKNNTIRVNRLIIAIILDRLLEREEEVHHINRIENDNRPENLILFKNHSDHKRFECGYKIKPIWNGSKDLTGEDVGRIKDFFRAGKKREGAAEKTAPIEYNKIEYNKILDKNLKVSKKVTNQVTRARNGKNRSGQPAKVEIIFNRKTGKFEGVKQRDITAWAEAYPACDVILEIKKAAAWAKANPKKAKKNWHRFINTWLNTTQEGGGTKGYLDKVGRDEWAKKKAQEAPEDDDDV